MGGNDKALEGKARKFLKQRCRIRPGQIKLPCPKGSKGSAGVEGLRVCGSGGSKVGRFGVEGSGLKIVEGLVRLVPGLGCT